MFIQSKNGTGSIIFQSDHYAKDKCALIQIDLINIEFIESVTIDIMPTDAADDEDLATICNNLFKMTEKLESCPIFPTLPLVQILVFS